MRNDLYITRTVTKTVYKDNNELLNVESGSNQIAFISGIVITLLIVGVISLSVVFCLRRREKMHGRIVLRDSEGNIIPGSQAWGTDGEDISHLPGVVAQQIDGYPVD